MKRLALIALTVGAGLMLARPGTTAAQSSAPPGGAYKMVSSLVPLPDFAGVPEADRVDGIALEVDS